MSDKIPDTKPPYKNEERINSQNNKMKGGNVMGSDTIKGCLNRCDSCLAKKNSCRVVHFETPVKITNFKGKAKDDYWYRFGTAGDPGTDWKHSEKMVKEINPKKCFAVTKLLTLKGFTGFFENIQVSVDPLNEKHFYRTLSNVEKILKKFPKVKIILRLRSVSSTDLRLNMLQNEAVVFANLNNLPVMETRMRFNRKDSIEKYSLVKEDYFMSDGKQTKPVWGKRFIVGAKRYYDCDLYGAKCENCSNCTLPWTKEQFEKKGEFIAPSKSKQIYPMKKVA